MTPNIAIVGTGPTGLYALAALAAHGTPLMITLYEKEGLGGVGMPYGPSATHAAMLANIASIEIPPLCETYLAWLKRQPEALLAPFNVRRSELHERLFVSRLLLGGYFRDQMECLMRRATENGHWIALRESAEIVDVELGEHDVRLSVRSGTGEVASQLHDRVILATGHSWPEREDRGGTVFLNPWTGLPKTDIPAGRVGVLGTSLSGIDTALAIALRHGRLSEGEDGTLAFAPSPGSEGLTIRLMSRRGLLPEADFHCPLPYEPLAVLTGDALDAQIRRGRSGLLDRLFTLFSCELEAADPAFAGAIGLAGLNADTFADAYFGLRLGVDPFEHAARNLAEVETNTRRRHTVPWRYALLRMTEPFDLAARSFDDADLRRFDTGLKRVFVDNYAAVPPLSIRRLLAMHRAGVLTVEAIGEDYDCFETDGTVAVRTPGRDLVFDVLVDARGQRRMGLRDLPFPTLRRQLTRAAPDTADVPIDKAFRLAPPDRADVPVWLPAAPYLLRRRPFIQGIVESAEMGRAVAASVLDGQAAPCIPA